MLTHRTPSPCSYTPGARGMCCGRHYLELVKQEKADGTFVDRRVGRGQKGDHPKGSPCTMDDCIKPIQAAGLCTMHYGRKRHHGDASYVPEYVNSGHTCSIDKCKAAASIRGMCGLHDGRAQRKGDPLWTPKYRRHQTQNGQTRIHIKDPDNPLPFANEANNGWVQEHRVVLVEKIGFGKHPCERCGELVTWDIVPPNKGGLIAFHLDGNTINNTPENLVPRCVNCTRARVLNPTQPRFCQADDCDRRTVSGGWCGKHLWRVRRHGDPNVVLGPGSRKRGTCSLDDCTKPHYGHGYCQSHWYRWKRYGDPNGSGTAGPRTKNRTCSVEGCEKKHSGRGYCGMHLHRFKAHGDPNVVMKRGHGGGKVRGKCTFEDCTRPHYGHGFCAMHHARWKTHGDPSVVKRRGRKKVVTD